jgi:DNA-binding IclR family transcriptional regulator
LAPTSRACSAWRCDGARQLQVAVQLGGAVLQRLEFADDGVELLALLQVGHRALEHLVGQAEHFGCRDSAADVEHLLQLRCAGLVGADDRAGGHAHAFECYTGGVVGIDHHGALDPHAGRIGRHEQQNDAAVSAGRHNQRLRHMAVDHEQLLASIFQPSPSRTAFVSIYLIHMSETGRYRLSMVTLSLGSAMLSRLDLRQVARPLMQELAAFSGASVSLGARERFSMIYIEHCRGPSVLTLTMDVGARIPLATSAIGRAYLAAIGEAERAEIMAQVQAHDPASWPKVCAGIERAVKDHAKLGVTCSFGDWQKDVNGIARAFQPGGGLPPTAINCGWPASSLSKDFLTDEVRPRLIELTQRLEATLPR